MCCFIVLYLKILDFRFFLFLCLKVIVNQVVGHIVPHVKSTAHNRSFLASEAKSEVIRHRNVHDDLTAQHLNRIFIIVGYQIIRLFVVVFLVLEANPQAEHPLRRRLAALVSHHDILIGDALVIFFMGKLQDIFKTIIHNSNVWKR